MKEIFTFLQKTLGFKVMTDLIAPNVSYSNQKYQLRQTITK